MAVMLFLKSSFFTFELYGEQICLLSSLLKRQRLRCMVLRFQCEFACQLDRYFLRASKAVASEKVQQDKFEQVTVLVTNVLWVRVTVWAGRLFDAQKHILAPVSAMVILSDLDRQNSTSGVSFFLSFSVQKIKGKCYFIFSHVAWRLEQTSICPFRNCTLLQRWARHVVGSANCYRSQEYSWDKQLADKLVQHKKTKDQSVTPTRQWFRL